MRTYPPCARGPRLGCGALLFLLVAFPAIASRQARAAPADNAHPAAASVVIPVQDAPTRAGFEHYYNLEYAAAISDFERALKAHPDDPLVVNHLLAAVLYSELYRASALDTGLYSNNSFLTKKRIAFDPKVTARIKELTEKTLELAARRLKENPNDVQALYARGLTRGLRATYIGLVEKTWFSALRNAIGARHDHERVLELAPDFVDAKTIVGVHNYVAGSLPWAVRAAISIVGLSGSKAKGLEYLYAAANGGGETSVDASIGLALFLRREQRFEEALALVRRLVAAHPRNFLFALEEANLLKDGGHGPESVAAYRKVLATGKEGKVYTNPHLELAAFGLGEALRGQHDYLGAAEAYESVRSFAGVDPDLQQRANLAAGEMYDLLQKRDLAIQRYQAVIAADVNSSPADIARRHLKEPYRSP